MVGFTTGKMLNKRGQSQVAAIMDVNKQTGSVALKVHSSHGIRG